MEEEIKTAEKILNLVDDYTNLDGVMNYEQLLNAVAKIIKENN